MIRNQPGGSPKVMVVAGMCDASNTLTEWLKVNGYQVMVESDLENAMANAVDFTQRERPDLILLTSTQLPSKDFATIVLLPDEVEMRNIPIVMLSDPRNQASHGNAAVAGYREYFVKSETAEQLTSLIDNLLQRSTENWDVDERKSHAKTQ
jgi:PleD family two-component response regulator